jgi:hypothetical protein
MRLDIAFANNSFFLSVFFMIISILFQKNSSEQKIVKEELYNLDKIKTKKHLVNVMVEIFVFDG